MGRRRMETSLTARECLKSDDPKAVGKFYEELRGKGRLGERAFQLLRVHRDVSRLRHYDDPKYMKFIEGRAAWAMQQLMDFINIDNGEPNVSKVTVVVPSLGPSSAVMPGTDVVPDVLLAVVFKRDRMGEWKSTKANERIIVAFCNQVMGGE